MCDHCHVLCNTARKRLIPHGIDDDRLFLSMSDTTVPSLASVSILKGGSLVKERERGKKNHFTRKARSRGERGSGLQRLSQAARANRHEGAFS